MNRMRKKLGLDKCLMMEYDRLCRIYIRTDFTAAIQKLIYKVHKMQAGSRVGDDVNAEHQTMNLKKRIFIEFAAQGCLLLKAYD